MTLCGFWCTWMRQVNLVMLGIAIYTMCRHAHTSVQSRQMKQKTKLQNIAYVHHCFQIFVFILLTVLLTVWRTFVSSYRDYVERDRRMMISSLILTANNYCHILQFFVKIIDQFSNVFTVRICKIFVIILSLKILPQLKCVATLLFEMSVS